MKYDVSKTFVDKLLNDDPTNYTIFRTKLIMNLFIKQ